MVTPEAVGHAGQTFTGPRKKKICSWLNRQSNERSQMSWLLICYPAENRLYTHMRTHVHVPKDSLPQCGSSSWMFTLTQRASSALRIPRCSFPLSSHVHTDTRDPEDPGKASKRKWQPHKYILLSVRSPNLFNLHTYTQPGFMHKPWIRPMINPR